MRRFVSTINKCIIPCPCRRSINFNSNIGGTERSSKKEWREQQRQKLKDALVNGQKIALDFFLPDIMTEKDRIKLVRQVWLLYHSNRNANIPFSLSFVGLKQDSTLYSCFLQHFDNFEDAVVNFVSEGISNAFENEKIIYLTPDASDALQSLDSKEIYVLGGLVDHQVRKNTTLRKATGLKIEARRLPIPEYMEKKDGRKFNYSKILSVNQVFDILLKYQETKDWTKALPIGIPARRGYLPRRGSLHVT